MSTSNPRHYDVILSPVITEKATMASEHNKVVFKVARNATKPQIKEAVEKLFDVKVKNVNTLIRGGKIAMQPGVDLRRRAGAHEHAHPAVEIELRQCRAHARYARQHRGAAGRRDRDRAHPLRRHMGQHADDVGEHQVHLPAQQVDERRGGALVRHVVHFHFCQRLQVFHAEVLQVADSGRGVIELARMGARQRDQLPLGDLAVLPSEAGGLLVVLHLRRAGACFD